jgi:hypothetical protein
MSKGQTCHATRLPNVALVYVGSLGTEPNWFARPLPPKVSPWYCFRQYLAARVSDHRDISVVSIAENGAPSNGNSGSTLVRS